MSIGIFIPMGWTQSALGELAEFEMGQAPPGNDCNFEGKGTLFVKAGEFGPTRPIEREWTTRPLKFGRSSDVFICVVGATCGKINLGIDCAIGRSVAAIRPKELLNQMFLYYQLQPLIPALRESSSGSAQGVLNKNQLAHIPIKSAPLQEQCCIAAKIEELFCELDAGVANLLRVRANLKRYRAAVLKAAVEGKLTEDWRAQHPDTEPASVLLARILTERRLKWEREQLAKFSDKGKVPPKDWESRYKIPINTQIDSNTLPPAGWCWSSVDQVATLDVGFAFQSAKFKMTGIRLLRGENIEPGSLRWTDTVYWSEEQLSGFEKLLINEGDIILAMDRPLISSGLKLSRAKAHDLPCLLVQRMARFKPVDPGINDFLYLCLQTRGFIRYLVGEQTGTQLPHISGSGIVSYQIPLPPVLEQSQIVAEVDRRLSIVDKIEAQVEANLKRAARLRQAILKRAFEGKLVPQDPTDEPAEQLLARIREQRQAAQPSTKAKAPTRRGRPRKGGSATPLFNSDDGTDQGGPP